MSLPLSPNPTLGGRWGGTLSRPFLPNGPHLHRAAHGNFADSFFDRDAGVVVPTDHRSINMAARGQGTGGEPIAAYRTPNFCPPVEGKTCGSRIGAAAIQCYRRNLLRAMHSLIRCNA